MQHWLFRRELEQLGAAPVFYLDECGVDHRLNREWGRAPRGERIYQSGPSQRRGRTSIISAAQGHKLVAPFVFEASCNTAVGDLNFSTVLLPQLPKGSVLVWDNARFHHSPTTAALVAAAGCQFLFLPAYSPDLNPIEHLWATLKTRFRKDLPTAANPFLFIGDMRQCCCQLLYLGAIVCSLHSHFGVRVAPKVTGRKRKPRLSEKKSRSRSAAKNVALPRPPPREAGGGPRLRRGRQRHDLGFAELPRRQGERTGHLR